MRVQSLSRCPSFCYCAAAGQPHGCALHFQSPLISDVPPPVVLVYPTTQAWKSSIRLSPPSSGGPETPLKRPTPRLQWPLCCKSEGIPAPFYGSDPLGPPQREDIEKKLFCISAWSGQCDTATMPSWCKQDYLLPGNLPPCYVVLPHEKW